MTDTLNNPGPAISPDIPPGPTAPGPGGWKLAYRWLMLLGTAALAMLAGWLVVTQAGAPREAGVMAGIFVLAAVLWVTEALPLFATSLLVVGLMALLLANPGGWPGLGFESGDSPSFRRVIETVADPVLLLFFGGFVMAHAAVRTGVDRVMSALLLRPFGTQPRRVLLGMMFVTMCFGMWMSNTATTAMMLAVVSPILLTLKPDEPFRKALILCIPLAANIGGMGTPIASPPNAVAVGFLASEGHHVSFLKWMLVAMPLILLLQGLGWALLCWQYPPEVKAIALPARRDRLSRRGWFVVIVFGISVLLWMTDMLHGLPAAGVALLPIVALTTTGIFTRDDLRQIDWSVLILIAGGIALGTGMQMTGLDRVIAGWIPQSAGASALLVALVLATVITGTFMSNTAAANLFLPIGISAAVASGMMMGDISGSEIASGGGLHPVHAAVSIALAASMSMALPVSTPPNAMAFATGELTTRQLATTMMAISSVAIIAIVLGGRTVMQFWGL